MGGLKVPAPNVKPILALLQPMQSDGSSSLKSHNGTECPHQKKRVRTDSETLEAHPKRRCLSHQRSDASLAERNEFCGSPQSPPPDQLPSPSLTFKSNREPIGPSTSPTTVERRAKSLDCPPPTKRTRLLSEPAQDPTPIDIWLSELPQSDGFEPLGNDKHLDKMNLPPSKRSRSSDSFGGILSQSGDGSDTVASRGKKYSVYQDVNYPIVLETKGSFMRPSEAGMVDEDRELCEKLLTARQPIPEDVLFDDDHFGRFYLNVRGRSEARICADLHPRVVPSVENLYICGRQEFEGLVEGYNDPWIKSIPFCGPRPQPDHTFGFKWLNFNEKQRRKLNIHPLGQSYYTAREEIYFPFLASEVKCGKHGLELADRPNAHSMTVALRGIVDLYRRTGHPSDVHRRVLGFSISHDDNGVRMYAHYPEVDGDKTTYWRETLLSVDFGNDRGKQRWTCYQFTLNVCEMFALPLLDRLRELIDELPDPTPLPLGLTATFNEISVQSSQDDSSVPEDESFKKPRNARGLNAELRNMVQSLQRQSEQQTRDSELQRQEAKEREALLLTQLEQLRQESEKQRKESEKQQEQQRQREVALLEQLAEQRKEFKEREAKSEEQQKELMKMLTEQKEQYQEQISLLKQLLNRS